MGLSKVEDDPNDQANEHVFNWTDDSALWELKYWSTLAEDKKTSAEQYLRARLDGKSRDEANELANGYLLKP